ncbi:MAG: hypothetical protein P4L50_28835 [Anaerolineaceae bacterium]|nr:hypothetical protein [Anaerolineaceae bacterium]
MNNYLLLYSGGSMPANESEVKAVTHEWEVWFGKLGGDLVDAGNPFTPGAKAIGNDGKVSDVPMSSMASGYSVIKADSLDSAVALAKGCPVLKGGARISVFETFNAMG